MSDADSPDAGTEARQPVRSLSEARSITRDRVRDVRGLLMRYVRRHDTTTPPPSSEPAREPPAPTGAYARLVPFLRLVPFGLTLLFVVSFFWDFPGLSISLPGASFALEGLLRIVSVSGLIGFLTNWLAINMLFHPREKRPIFGQGLIPAQRERVIYRLARAVSEELINEDIIKARIRESQIIPRYRKRVFSVTRGVLEDSDFRRDVKALTADYVERVLTSNEVRQKIVDFTVEKMEEHASRGIAGVAFKTYRFFNEEDFQRRIDEAVRELPGSLDYVLDEMDHLLDRLPAQIEARSDDIEDWTTRAVLRFVENIDVYSIIVDNMENYDERRLERLLRQTSDEQFNYIKYLGGVLGFFGGLVIWEPLLALTAFVLIGLGLYGLDGVLYRRQNG